MAHTTTDQGGPQTNPSGQFGEEVAVPSISAMRARIDEIDAALIQLWQERAAISQRTGMMRVAAGGTRLALAREREILERFREALGPDGTQLALLILRSGRGPLLAAPGLPGRRTERPSVTTDDVSN
jgi:chorismate mutase